MVEDRPNRNAERREAVITPMPMLEGLCFWRNSKDNIPPATPANIFEVIDTILLGWKFLKNMISIGGLPFSVVGIFLIHMYNITQGRLFETLNRKFRRKILVKGEAETGIWRRYG